MGQLKTSVDTQIVVTFAIVIVALGLLLSDRLRPDLVALMTVVALGASGILTPQEAFSGFGRSAVITIMAIFILAEGLQRNGVIERLGNLLVRLAGRGEGRLVAVVMLAGAGLSLFMNNIAAAAPKRAIATTESATLTIRSAIRRFHGSGGPRAVAANGHQSPDEAAFFALRSGLRRPAKQGKHPSRTAG